MSDEVSREVDELLKDREKFESWLERLEGQKSDTSERAYERVRRDYQQRLEEVIQRLQDHGHTLKARLGELKQQVDEFEVERTNRAEELDEAQLRHAVGEYGEGTDWQDLENRLVASLRETEGKIEAVRNEIGRLEEIVAVVERPAQPPEAPPVVEAEPRPVTSTLPPEVIETAEPAPPAAVPEAPAVEPLPKPPPPEPVVEAAPPVEPVVQAPRPEPFAEPPPAPPKPPPAPPPEPETVGIEVGGDADEGHISLGELVLEDQDLNDILSEPAQAEPEPAAAEPETTPKADAKEGAGLGDELAFLESLSLGGDEEAEGFTFLEQRGSGTPQTIICPHCSAANDPAEWYCTECGEELPAE